MFLSPLGERLGEGVQYEDRLLHHPLTQPLPQGGEEEERRGDEGGASYDQTSRAPTASLAAAAHSPAPTLGPSAGFTRSTLMRPSGQTPVKPSAETSTTSPYLPPIPLGSRAGRGWMSKTCRFLPSIVVQAPGAGLQPRPTGSIWRHNLPQSMRAMPAGARPSDVA